MVKVGNFIKIFRWRNLSKERIKKFLSKTLRMEKSSAKGKEMFPEYLSRLQACTGPCKPNTWHDTFRFTLTTSRSKGYFTTFIVIFPATLQAPNPLLNPTLLRVSDVI